MDGNSSIDYGRDWSANVSQGTALGEVDYQHGVEQILADVMELTRKHLTKQLNNMGRVSNKCGTEARASPGTYSRQ